jgi:hypothetical protein
LLQEKSTDFWISLQAVGSADAAEAIKLEPTAAGGGLAGPGFDMPLH